MKNRAEDSAFFWSVAAEFLNSYLPDVRRASGNTVASYRNCLNRYVDYLESEKGVKRKEISFKMLDRENIKGIHVMDAQDRAIRPKNLQPQADGIALTLGIRVTGIHRYHAYLHKFRHDQRGKADAGAH